MSPDIWTSSPNLGPWRGQVVISTVQPRANRRSSLPFATLFVVNARWAGPPAPGFPASDTPVDAHASVTLTRYTDARQVADQTVDQLRHGHVPDLRKIARDLPTSGSLAPARGLIITR